ncbi:hypothetical protein OSB04_021881 [Centaurea solstitialis]|uniref:DNA polymerase alpha subunit B n=1 Tax=Centaurea solstitialis TaxID=347529 RepID=A0AA38TEU8_9ASTR|nr:hypothetical protein OSB04_021881 [Centaurea solstitialis]
MEDQIRAEFKKNNFVLVEEEEILQKCLTFCINYDLSPSDLVSSWDLYSINRDMVCLFGFGCLQSEIVLSKTAERQLELTVSNAHMDAFRQQLQIEQKQAIIEKEQGIHTYTDVTMELNDEFEDGKEIVPTSPARQNVIHLESFDATPITNGGTHTFGKPLELVTPFGQRKDKFVVLSTLNSIPIVNDIKKEQGEENMDDDVIKRVQPSQRCSLEILSSQPASGCRYMYDRIEDKFNCLEDRIMKYSKALVASHLYEEPVDPSVASQKSIFAVGMICCEEEGRLKEKPIMLQSSVEHSGGQRVRLDLQKLDQVSLFPGQVVGVEGHNPSGHYLIATKIVDYVPLSVPVDDNSRQTKRQAVEQDNHPADSSDTPSDLSLIIASGPFTTTDNLFFEPLSELLAYAQRSQPQLLVLLGPFIDSEHPEIKKGTLNRTYDELFRLEVLRRLQDYVEYMGSAARVILVPSIRDAHHDYVFPQPAFDINLADLSHQGAAVWTSSNSLVRMWSHGDQESHGYANKSSLEPTKNSFYPLYPPAEDTPVDLSLAPEALRMSTVPDILITPSDLTQFVKRLKMRASSNLNSQILPILEKLNHLNHVKQLQAYLITNGHSQDQFFSFKLLRCCVLSLSNFHYARQIFSSLASPNVYLYTAMITAYASQPDHDSSLLLYREMVRKQRPKVSHFIYPHVLKSCPEVLGSNGTKMVHAQIVGTGYGEYPVVQTALIDAYSRFSSDVGVARRLFDEMSERNVVSWTAMISGYTRAGEMGSAVELFDEMPDRDTPSWNSIIAGCTHNGMYSEAIRLLRRMVADGMKPNHVTVLCSLSAFGHTGMLQLGKSTHAYVLRNGLAPNSLIANGLVDMYGKCGSLKEARRVFDNTSNRNLTSWNSMINSFALHGQSESAIKIYDEMMERNVKPDSVTFVGLLNACTHGGLVEKGRSFFTSMVRENGIEPDIHHIGCFIDLLGRAGEFSEAMEVIESMKTPPDEAVWGSLLNGCKIHGRMDLAEIAVKKLIEIDPNNGGYGTMLANIYGALGEWEKARMVWITLKEQKAYKIPGCSWIEIDSQVHQFYSADDSHFKIEEIHSILESVFGFADENISSSSFIAR